MANNRITNQFLEANFVDGRILTAEDLNKIVRYIIAGVNSNKHDLDKMLMGKEDSIVLYDRNHLTNDLGENGDLATVFTKTETEDALGLFRKVGGSWQWVTDVSLIEIYEKILTGEGNNVMVGTATVFTETGPLTGFITVDNHTLKENDTVLVAGHGVALNGIYQVNSDGTWNRTTTIEVNQVVSIDSGHVFGGSMQKKMYDGTTLMVKKPERSSWRVFI